MSEIRYAADKPKDCKYCYFWRGKQRGCLLTEERCYYILPPKEEKEKGPCEDCPYGKGRPCVSFCMKKILEDQKKKGAGK